jgi:hypothetical protein
LPSLAKYKRSGGGFFGGHVSDRNPSQKKRLELSKAKNR